MLTLSFLYYSASVTKTPRLQEAVHPTTQSSMSPLAILETLLETLLTVTELVGLEILLSIILECPTHQLYHQPPLLPSPPVQKVFVTTQTPHNWPFKILPTWFHARTAVRVETTSAVSATTASVGQCHSLFQALRTVYKR